MSVCYIPKDFVLSIGGWAKNNNYLYCNGLEKVECYDIKNDSWRSVSSLNSGRKYSSSCYHAKNVYVFCGLSDSGMTLNSIESLSEDAL